MDQVSLTSAYMWAIVVLVVFFLVAAFVANMIAYKPNDPGTTARRVWFWILAIGTGVVGFLINYAMASNITVPTIKSDYLMHAGIASGVCLVVFILLGFIVSKIFPSSKLGTWF